MEKSSGKSLRTLEALWRKRKALLKALLTDEPVLLGTVYDTLRRCGNPTCQCAKEPTHLQTLLTFTKAGERKCRFVRQEDAPKLYQAAERYRAWKKALKEFQTLQNREAALLKVQIRKKAIPMK